MKTVKEWFGKRGFKSIGLLAGIFLPFFFLGFSPLAWFICGGCSVLFVYINWQPLKDLSYLDEKIEQKYFEVKAETEILIEKGKAELQDQIDDLKRKLVGLNK